MRSSRASVPACRTGRVTDRPGPDRRDRSPCSGQIEGTTDDERHRQHRRVRPLPAPAAVGRGPGVRRRWRQGHPLGGLPRRGHHHHGRGGGPPGPARRARRPPPTAIWFATATPAYLDKTNATAIHAALRQPAHVAAFDFGGALRSGSGALRSTLGAAGTGTTLVVLADLRDGLPTSADESAGGDGAAAVVVGDDGPGPPVIAEYLGGASVSDEFLDRWRTAGDRRSRVWEERFGETRYVPLGHRGLGGGPQGGRR